MLDSAADHSLPINTDPITPPTRPNLLIIMTIDFVTHYLNMYYSNTLKILVVGPEGSGKTAITNFLCGKSNVLEVPYRPTAGVRIVETEK